MTKIVVVEETVNVGAKDPARLTNGAVWHSVHGSMALDIGERTHSGLIERFTDVDLVAFETSLRRNSATEKTVAQGPADAPHSFLRAHYSSHRQQTESRLINRLAVILDTQRVVDRNTEHLKAAADTDDGEAGSM